jgi:hypothetical protein
MRCHCERFWRSNPHLCSARRLLRTVLYPVLVGPCPGRTRPGQDKGGQYRVAKNAPRNDTKGGTCSLQALITLGLQAGRERWMSSCTWGTTVLLRSWQRTSGLAFAIWIRLMRRVFSQTRRSQLLAGYHSSSSSSSQSSKSSISNSMSSSRESS